MGRRNELCLRQFSFLELMNTHPSCQPAWHRSLVSSTERGTPPVGDGSRPTSPVTG